MSGNYNITYEKRNGNKKIAQKLHKDRDEILNFCSLHNRIILYGTGIVGKAIFQYLTEEKIEVFAFVVSDGYRKEKEFCSKRVYELGEFHFEDNDGIVLAANSSMQKEMLTLLINICFPINDVYVQTIYYKNSNTNRVEACLLKTNFKNEKYFEEYSELDKLGKKYGTDKSSVEHNYLKKYEFFLNKWKDKNIKILELGVFEGSSINMWGAYFTNATVYGVDIEKECIKYEGENRKIIIQDLADEEGLNKLGKIQPNIVIDDASHLWTHQIKALYHLLPQLQSGGVYILEDLGTSFSSYRNANFDDAPFSAYDFCSAIAEVVTSGELLRTANLQAALFPLKSDIEFLALQISMISFIHESCIIVKK